MDVWIQALHSVPIEIDEVVRCMPGWQMEVVGVGRVPSERTGLLWRIIHRMSRIGFRFSRGRSIIV